MNGYQMLADSYRKAVKQGIISQEEADKETRVLDFLATCTQEDFCRMVDSSAFNDIMKAYFMEAVNRANLDEETGLNIRNELRFLLDEKTAKEILEL